MLTDFDDEEQIMSFEEYCVDVLDVLNYNFMSKEEYEKAYEKYEKYLERNVNYNAD